MLDGRPSVTYMKTVNSYDNPSGRYHCTDDRIEAQSSRATCPGLHKERERAPRFDSGLSVSKAFDFHHKGDEKRYELT